MTSTHSSSPIKGGHSPVRRVRDAIVFLKDIQAVCEVSDEDFSTNYLPAGGKQPEAERTWTEQQGALVEKIRQVALGNEKGLYTGFAPLLRLCNIVSKRIFDAQAHTPRTALVFYHCYNQYLVHPFSGPPLAPDIIILHENPQVLENVLDSLESDELKAPKDQNWSNIVAVGEAKVGEDAQYQLGNYLRNQLQLRPDFHSVLGFSANIKGYSLFYHDASVIHRTSNHEWTPGPLHAFVRQLYHGVPCDPSIFNPLPKQTRPSWAIRVGSDILVAVSAKPDPGLGQRRFTTIAKHVQTRDLWFIKDFYRDDRRRFFEGVLYDKAHAGQALPGLMRADHYGYPLGMGGNVLKTTTFGNGPYGRAPINRSKMRVATQDVGRALSETKTLGEFLRVMYDACVVQRNLYRKCKILHRDISDNNIMVAPKEERFYARCVGGYDQVKYLNQVLEPNEQPKPACLVIDLGNGADLGVESEGSQVLAERTGTPKFISRSVSKGKLLNLSQHKCDGINMPRLDGQSLLLYTPCGNVEYEEFNRTVDQKPSFKPDECPFAHQLFHDAESTFWVMAWFLARSAPKGYKTETDWKPEFEAFVYAMDDHYPSPTRIDPRSGFSADLETWKQILHPGLDCMASMLNTMHNYILPEWGYRPELNAEHAHEALMRLLLLEIIRIHDDGADIDFNVGTRALPTKTRPTSSFSNSLTTASSLTAPINAKKRSRSHEEESSRNPRPSPRQA